jgi:hypothetical protein
MGGGSVVGWRVRVRERRGEESRREGRRSEGGRRE